MMSAADVVAFLRRPVEADRAAGLTDAEIMAKRNYRPGDLDVLFSAAGALAILAHVFPEVLQYAEAGPGERPNWN